MKKGIIYSRVSTDHQDTQSQIDSLKLFAKSDGVDILEDDVYKEKITGTSELQDRQEMSRLIKHLQNNKVDYIYVWEISRIARKTALIYEFLKICAEKKICVVVKEPLMRTINSKGEMDATGSVVIAVLAALATLEHHQLLERFARGRKNKVLTNGTWVNGKPPFAFKLNDKKQLEADEKKAQILIKMFQMYADGNSTVKITNWLNSKGIKTRYGKEKWHENTIREMLINPIYNGVRKHGKGENAIDVPNTPTIIDDELFMKVNNRINTIPNQKDKKRYNYIIHQKIIHCGECKSNYIYRNSKNDKSIKCSTYRLKNKKLDGEFCGNNGVGIEKFNNIIYLVMIHRILAFDKSSLLNEKRHLKNQIDNIKAEIEKTENEILNADKKIEELYDKFANDKVTMKNLNKTEIKINEKKKIDKATLKIQKMKLSELVSIKVDEKFEIKIENKARINNYIKNTIQKVIIHKISNTNFQFSNRNSDVYTVIEIIPITGRATKVLSSRFTNKFLAEGGSIGVHGIIDWDFKNKSIRINNKWIFNTLPDYSEFWDFSKDLGIEKND